MILYPAQYLLRIDDLCPTVAADRWLRLQELVEEFHLHPILAIVPKNQDPDLEKSPPDPDFWRCMHALEASGAAIGVHGYRHLCISQCRSMLGMHRTSEFAGVTVAIQRKWIHDGLRILREQGLTPRIWVAPRHGFDMQTLIALRAEGILLISDGFASTPFMRCGMTWLPQQLWGPSAKRQGLWTICIHPNTATDAEIAALRRFLSAHATHFISVDRALMYYQPAALSVPERIRDDMALWRFRVSRTLKLIRHLPSLRPDNPV
jgi:predicted deacetylase